MASLYRKLDNNNDDSTFDQSRNQYGCNNKIHVSINEDLWSATGIPIEMILAYQLVLLSVSANERGIHRYPIRDD